MLFCANEQLTVFFTEAIKEFHGMNLFCNHSSTCLVGGPMGDVQLLWNCSLSLWHPEVTRGQLEWRQERVATFEGSFGYLTNEQVAEVLPGPLSPTYCF